MNYRPRLHSIANDHQRAALVRAAAMKGVEQARGDFYYGMLMEGQDEESIAIFADEAWDMFSRHTEFDYPQFARKLYVQAYRSAYSKHVQALASGHSLTTAELFAAVEAEIGLTPPDSASVSD